MKIYSLILFFLSISGHVLSQHLQWGSLKPGRYEVGYRTFLWYDSTRQYNEGPRPIQVFVWYPTARSGERMKFDVYFQDISHDWGTAAENIKYLDGYFRSGFTTSAMNPSFPGKLSESDFKKLLDTRTAAIRNAVPAPGKFPVVLHRHVTAALHQSVAMEFLASHGYVAVSVSAYNTSAAYYGRGQDGPLGLMSATEDLAFIVGKLRRVSFADMGRAAMFGMMSEVGISLQMKQPTFRSIACFDCLGYNTALESLPHYDIAKLKIPMLEVVNADFEDEVTSANRSYLDTMKYSDRWFGRSKDLHHADFYPYPKLLQKDGGRQTHDHLLKLALNFFNATLNSGGSGLSEGLPDNFISLRHREAALAPPGKDELLARVRYGPVEDARKWLNAFPELRTNQFEIFFFTILMVRGDDPLALDAAKLYLEYFREPQHRGMIGESFKNNGRAKEAEIIYSLWKN